MTACILCPGALADPAAQEPVDWPAAAATTVRGTLLRRGRFARHEARTGPLLDWPHDAWLRQRFGLPDDAHPDAYEALDAHRGADATDAADVARRARSGALVARPVHLHVGLDHLMLMPPHAVSLSRTNADELRDAANAHFGADGPRLEIVTPGCWLLVPPEPLSLRTRPASVAVGRHMGDYLPDGPDARRAASWVNEVQMLWHGHPVNEQREAEGHLPVNGLWLEGALPEPARRPFAAVHSDHAGIRALARAAGTAQVEPAPRSAAELQALLGERDDILVEFALWRRPVLEGDAHAWRDAWQAFGDRIASALRKAPATARLELVFTGERSLAALEWSPRDRWKWWRGAAIGPGPAETIRS